MGCILQACDPTGSCTYCSLCQHWPWNFILQFSAAEPHNYAVHLARHFMMSSPESRWLLFLSHSTRLEQSAFLSLFIIIIRLSSLETSGFDHCQGPINEQDGLFMFSRKVILMIIFQYWYLLALRFKGLSHHTVVDKRHGPGNLYLSYGKQDKISPSHIWLFCLLWSCPILPSCHGKLCLT